MYNVQKVRNDFPILQTGVIYFDNSSTSLTPEPVLQKMMEYYQCYRSNIDRGIYHFSQQSSDEYAHARSKIASFIGAKSPSEIICTKNATEAINIVANGLTWNKGDQIVTTMLEHHSNFIVWLNLKNKFGVNINIIHPDRSGLIDLSRFEKIIDDQTKLVAVTQASNVLGVVVPVKEICHLAHEHDALVLVDGAQSVPHLGFDAGQIETDFLAFSGHKMCGPTGSGILYVQENVLEKLKPHCLGGGVIDDVGLDYFSFTEGPRRFEAGTPPIAEIIGLGAAVDYLENIGMENIRCFERELTKKIYDELVGIKGVEVYGPEPKDKIGVTSFNVGKLNPHDVALALDTLAKIAVRSGHHCALPLMKNFIHRPDGTVRASTYLYNTTDEVDTFISTLKELAATTIVSKKSDS